MVRFFARDDSGEVTTDWVTLTAGILLLGIMIVYTMMNDSAGYLMSEFEQMNSQYEASVIDDVSAATNQANLKQ